MSLTKLFEQLQQTPTGFFFNPWVHYDPDHDTTPNAPSVRRRQLEAYLEERLKTARWLFIAEALGYQGGHFTGIAMTSERILLGYQKEAYNIDPGHVFRTIQPERTSKPALKKQGMSEPTATIMWGALATLGLNPYQVVLWNALPWHPYRNERGLLSNRTPAGSEMEFGRPVLETFLDQFDGTKVVAVGRKCEQLLDEMRVEHLAVRHPANGGAPKFRNQLAEMKRREFE